VQAVFIPVLLLVAAGTWALLHAGGNLYSTRAALSPAVNPLGFPS